LKKPYGHLFRILHWCSDQAVTQTLAGMELTAAQGHILSYLAHRDTPPCSHDIEEKFHLSHPTVSGLLSRLEKKDFIEFRPDPQDRRCKRIFLLDRGRACHDSIMQAIAVNEEKVVRGFTREEQAQFAAFLERAAANLDARPCCNFPKEEKQT